MSCLLEYESLVRYSGSGCFSTSPFMAEVSCDQALTFGVNPSPMLILSLSAESKAGLDGFLPLCWLSKGEIWRFLAYGSFIMSQAYVCFWVDFARTYIRYPVFCRVLKGLLALFCRKLRCTREPKRSEQNGCFFAGSCNLTPLLDGPESYLNEL